MEYEKKPRTTASSASEGRLMDSYSSLRKKKKKKNNNVVVMGVVKERMDGKGGCGKSKKHMY